jgi:peptidoglycan/xylan/chitin deacetylase (PgdA/CDA1 family)
MPTPTGIQVVTQCVSKEMVAVTFDDGPYEYMQSISQQIKTAGGKATFFVNGFNYGCIYDRADTLKQVMKDGHQIASHTWSHPYLTQLSDAEIQYEMNRLKTAFRKILGVETSYMRPPYGDYNQHVNTVLQDLGYQYNVLWSLDSGDSLGLRLTSQKERYLSSSSEVGQIALNHETSQTTATLLVPYIIDWAKTRNLKMVTVSECLGNTSMYSKMVIPETRNPTWTCA